jgi:hypothetical protein
MQLLLVIVPIVIQIGLALMLALQIIHADSC